MTLLTHNSYGKSSVRLTKVTRNADSHDLCELTVDVELEGDFEPSYTTGDNRLIVATDSMKNTVYALGRQHTLEHAEDFALHLARHFVKRYPQVTQARIRVVQHPWERIRVEGDPHPTAFVGGGSERRVCTVVHSRTETRVVSGLEELLVLKTTDSSFEGFLRDEFTTLPDTADRILATSVTAHWLYAPGEHNWNAVHRDVRARMLDVFARHHSPSVQQTLLLMAEAALEACSDITEITLLLPNRHRLLVDLTPFALDNPNQIFVPTEEPFGMISGTVRRGE